jgi:hypothetical protein
VKRYRLWLCFLLLTGCGQAPEASHAPFETLGALQARFGPLVTTGNHPTPDQHGTGDRIGFFRGQDGTVWGLPLSLRQDGGLIGCAPAALADAAVTDEVESAATLIGSANEPTGWRGGTGKLELVLRKLNGDVYVHGVSGGKLPHGPSCWAQLPPGPVQELFYYRIAPSPRL